MVQQWSHTIMLAEFHWNSNKFVTDKWKTKRSPDLTNVDWTEPATCKIWWIHAKIWIIWSNQMMWTVIQIIWFSSVFMISYRLDHSTVKVFKTLVKYFFTWHLCQYFENSAPVSKCLSLQCVTEIMVAKPKIAGFSQTASTNRFMLWEIITDE